MTDTTNPQQTAPVCKFEEGCHRVVACEPGCAAATVPAPAPTDQAALRSDLEDALKGAGVYDSKERMWHSLSPEWIEEILTEVLAVLPAPAACSDPIECSHEAALGETRARVERLALTFEVSGNEFIAERIREALGGESAAVPVPPVDRCIHVKAIHDTHHRTPVTGCPWCTATEKAAGDPS